MLIKNVSILGSPAVDLRVEDGKYAAIYESGVQNEYREEEIIDARGLILLPGLVDTHTHLRQPGMEEAETIASGTRAAAKGGYTAVCAMANTNPVTDTPELAEQTLKLAEAAGFAKVVVVGAVTKNLAGKELSPMQEMAQSSAKVRIFSDDGMCVWDANLMREALKNVSEWGGVIAQHAQEPALTVGAQMNAGEIAERLGLKGWPAIAEEIIIARDILLAEETGANLHICHLSTRGAIELVRWGKQKGVKITAEATPHHLLLDEENALSKDPVYKVNPPLRRREDVVALRQAVADGTIDVIGTDHAPHPESTKTGDWAGCANGMIGLETALAVVNTVLVQSGMITYQTLAEIMSYKPAQIAGLVEQGQPVKVGNHANFCLFDPEKILRVDREKQYSKAKNTPYHGLELRGEVRYTVYEGKITYFAED